MASRRGLVGLATLLVMLGGAAVVASGTFAVGNDPTVTVDSHTVEPPTREDNIRQWQTVLARSGKTLPAGVGKMTDDEIFEAMWAELRKYTVLEKQPTVSGD
ncbi:hypothetical protein ACFW96_30610 [Streptomyces gardneri]|uniref:hypothetical protein n=1 Tax=Streptomyces gardneri TaxID=66892 RepID=UPI0036D1A27D